ncbi:MAG: hypothetical protein HN712_11175 [Gemmatimonadetes bacterium]|jgi:hypothetical protein|nr:hypothetical protein [Gemmatimonadota bacterium]MBT6146088.1 hypothetical protein [Gemmatimonadota bacterium]MBT7860868.1 hypothetical protein [Gemmatimonadota bacterium]
MTQPAGPAKSDPRRGRSWAWGIIGAYSSFAVLTLVMVGFAFSQRVDLVSDDYYQREIDHQQHIDRVTRTQELPDGVEWTVTHQDGDFLFELPKGHFNGDLQGQIHFYRPDNSTLDRTHGIHLDVQGQQRITAAGLPAGHWRIHIEWQVAGLDYYSERELNISGTTSGA